MLQARRVFRCRAFFARSRRSLCEQVHAIAKMARALSESLGYPADLEGAFVGSQLMLFQARPITTLGAVAA